MTPTTSPALAAATTHQQDTALFVAAFFDELTRWGVRDVVVSPGSRSTALAMAAHELSCRRPHDLRLFVDIDERGASFLALGMAKASGRPVALVCTSGTALANYYPAVIEASTSRVPLIVLSADRPPQLQGLGAPQTTDQLKAYGDQVRAFRAMPLPAGRDRDIAFARQAAREAVLAALGPSATVADDLAVGGLRPGFDNFGELANYDPNLQVAARASGHYAGPVHLNFPLAAPLKPDFPGADMQAALRGARDCFSLGARAVMPARRKGGDATALTVGPLLGSTGQLSAAGVAAIEEALRKRPTLVLVGEGACETLAEAEEIVAWARRWSFPLLADPLSGLRSLDEPLVIDNYDNLCRHGACPRPEVVIRFGRYPVSKATTAFLEKVRPLSIVVDVAETRDFSLATDVFVGTTPLGFVRSPWHGEGRKAQRNFADAWVAANDEARLRVLAVEKAGEVEGAYVRALLELIPEGSCLFSANSMPIRALDTFYLKDGKPIAVMANRGQNGIDGVVSTALGAAQHFSQTTFLTGDFTLLHDLNALALQREIKQMHKGAAEGEAAVPVANIAEAESAAACPSAVPSARAAGAFAPRRGAHAAPDPDATVAFDPIADVTLAGDGAMDVGAVAAPVAVDEGSLLDDGELEATVPSIVIVLLNNNGGAIFDMLPQASDDPYFERLFLAPQDVDFQAAADAFMVPSARVTSVRDFREAYAGFLGHPGISLIEVALPLRGVRDRYAPYQA